MNKANVNALLPEAYKVIKKVKIANREGKIPKTYRGYISSFGAAVAGGSLLAAIAFFSDKGNGEEDRSKIVDALNELIQRKEHPQVKLFEYVKGKIVEPQNNGNVINVEKQAEYKEKIIDAAIALKLAMNLYELV